MRFRHPDGSLVHLAYCTNVHPAETLDAVVAQLRDHCEPVRRRLGRDRLGIGLWLAKDAALALENDPCALTALRTELDRRGLEVVTLNGFPYEGFGSQQVKYRVYTPDWADPERLRHTTTLARILAGLLPDDIHEGSISTLPLAWRTTASPDRMETARTALRTLGERLDALADLTGRSLRIGLEPEPGCVIETTADALTPSPTSPTPASASASTPATSPPPSKIRTPPWTPSPTPVSPSSNPSSPPPCTPSTPTARTSARPSPRSPSPGSCTRPAPSPPPAGTAPTTSARPSRTAPCPTPRPGAPTSTSPCTRPRPRPSPPPFPSSPPH